MKKMKCVLPLIALLILSSSAHAALVGDFGVDGGLSWGIGSAKNSTGSITSRTVNAFSINAFPNYSVAGFQLGVLGQYSIIGQNTDPATVSNTNLKGNAWLVGVGAEYQILAWTFSAGFNFLGNYSISANNSAGQSVSYKKPIGFLLKAGYFIIPMVSIDGSFQTTSYGTTTVASTDSDISANKLSETNFAVGGTYHF